MKIDQAVNIDDLRRMCRRRLPRIAFDYIEGGADDERGMLTNEAGFLRYRLLPRYLVDVSRRDQSTTLFGKTYSSPFGFGPTGTMGLFRRGGELMLAEAAPTPTSPTSCPAPATPPWKPPPASLPITSGTSSTRPRTQPSAPTSCAGRTTSAST